MAEKDKVSESKVKWSGLFDFKETYNFCYNWLNEEDYFVEEKKYIEELAGDAKKVEIVWEATKKVSDYFKYHLKMTWRIVGMKSVEVEQNGRKVKMNTGSFEIKTAATLVKDWDGTWESSPVNKFLRGVYDKFIIEGRIRQYEDKVFGDMNNFSEAFKAFLALEGRK